MSEDAEREAYRRGALALIEEVKRRFWKANPGGVLYMRPSDSAYWMRVVEQEIAAGEWPKGDADGRED
jgi:hypothetical protein